MILAGVIRLLARLAGDRSGAVIQTFAIATPAIAVLTLGAVDLAAVSADKRALQDVADAAALQAARELGVADAGGLVERTKAQVATQLTELKSRVTYDTAVDADAQKGSVEVRITANRASFFVNLLPPGGWNFDVVARAERMGSAPLCVLSFGDGSDDLEMKDQAAIQAPGCLVHGNADLAVGGSASLTAGIVQAAGLASGNISPAPQTDAPAIDDPFAGMTITDGVGICSPLDLVAEILPLVLTPGVHCGNIKAIKSGTITLLPGEHYFRGGTLQLLQNSTLYGDNVVLIFDKDSRFMFKDSSNIRLRGRRQGGFAGFVVLTTRDNDKIFEISSSAARELLGTVYIPGAELLVSGKDRIADQSAWTVVVTKKLTLKESPDLVINKNYAGSSTPVPQGVGSNTVSTGARLTN